MTTRVSAYVPPETTTTYLDGWSIGLLLIGLVTMGVCLVSGLRGRPPGRLTLGATLVLQLAVAVFFAIYLLRSSAGESPAGPFWELWAYLVTILFLPAVAWLWARDDETRWGTFVLALAGFVVAVMGARTAQIWHGVGQL